MKPVLHIKRIYGDRSPADGYRVLVDRLWPRGIKKEDAHFDEWAKDLAPSTDLRKWYGHDPVRWPAFQEKYRLELKGNTAVKEFVQAHAQKKTITLLYAAKEGEQSNAMVLQQYLAELF